MAAARARGTGLINFAYAVNVRDHIKILGILNIIMGGLIALVGIVVLLIFGGIAGSIATGIHDTDPEHGARTEFRCNRPGIKPL